ncbi:Rossmann-like and DUF2520 domain-containing protein [Cellulomonas biazotea]|uniref:Oxidoreductase n=1 Tax=Cellulomonas biazotea TaxID=1709 RepID=A0A402DR20_9CELL|nr:DUF2520 domain-containing protein [Cellulomonas biazotea]GCE76583.1 oxidoreductase [Cellulomonas biazotea]
MTRPGRLGVGVVGTGRVGAVLGNALRGAGHPVVAASGISEASRERAEALLPGVPLLDVQEVVRRAELVLLTVPDDALADLVRGLADLGAWQPGQIVVHTSGRFGTDVLDPARAAGVIPLAIHPAMTFTGTSLDLARLAGCPFAVTGPGAVLPIGQALVVEVGGEPVVVDEAARGLYHAALAHGANHLVVLVAQAAQALAAAGVEDPGRMLGPLLEAALDGALRAESPADPSGDRGAGAIGALTGPVRRGDDGTVREHTAVLGRFVAASGAVDVLDSYRTLARGATRRALAAGIVSDDAATRVLDALADGPADVTSATPPAGEGMSGDAGSLDQEGRPAGDPPAGPDDGPTGPGPTGQTRPQEDDR